MTELRLQLENQKSSKTKQILHNIWMGCISMRSRNQGRLEPSRSRFRPSKRWRGICAVRTVDEMTGDKEICSGKDGASDNINEMAMKTVACRCEEITLATIRKWIGEGYDTFDELKRLLRVGMGPCQGRGCRDIVLREISQITGKSISEIPIGTLRPPAKPIKIELSANQTLEVTGDELEEYR